MPDSLLLFAFALTLVLNAALIVVAIRAMRPGGQFEDAGRDARVESGRARTPGRAVGETSAPGASESASRRSAAEPYLPPPPAWTAGAATDQEPEPGAGSAGRRQPAPTADPDPAPEPAPEPTRGADRVTRGTSKRSRRPSKPPEGSDGTSPPTPPKKARSGNGRRRRFSLPVLDEDPDRVNRSIETFLSGGDSGTDAPPPAASDVEGDQPPTTVALVAVPEPGDAERPLADQDVRTDPHERSPHERSPADAAVGAVERSLRSAARGTDRVEALAPGKFRIVLASTGELAARAYLRRVRATVEPLLEELEPPRRLVVATATVLGEPLDLAHERAERRLAATLDAHEDGDDAIDQPRAAAD